MSIVGTDLFGKHVPGVADAENMTGLATGSRKNYGNSGAFYRSWDERHTAALGIPGYNGFRASAYLK